ncbi:MAG TPA: KUP/HAK/KT family potassium transporter, partial [Candidatus Ozemobacteraceae bacterium]|nr:KUP/HAK/KT family potassium transporter [Candidatus Ozemobacteraceae bacterium]
LVVTLGLFGTSLLLADGVITPVISVLSAVEGLEIATPFFKSFILPLTLGILILLFSIQKRGTDGVASIFGPAMVLWFAVLGLLGLSWVMRAPEVLGAVNPLHALSHFARHGWSGFLPLGSVVLCITGAEALYADMGHFGTRPITLAWYALVYPCLLLNYFGQGAVLLSGGEQARHNPFYALAPGWALYPLVILATLATIIASQALISGAFSLARQAIQLGYCPRLDIVHTSRQTEGQIYIPEVNVLLMTACILLTLSFRESSALAAAYGIAVMGTMTITSVLLFFVMMERWNWSRNRAAAVIGLFLCLDLPYLFSNMGKIVHGGWVPLLMGGFIFCLMTTWKLGRATLMAELSKTFFPLREFMKVLPLENPHRVRGTGVFMTSNRDVAPMVLLHQYKHNKVLHERIILLSIITERQPDIAEMQRLEIHDLRSGFHQVIARYGFMETPRVPDILDLLEARGMKMNRAEISFFLGRETLLTSGRTAMSPWRKSLFAFLSRNAR